MATRQDVEGTNERRRLRDLSLNLFQYLNHSNTPIRQRTIDDVTAEARTRAHHIFTHWGMLHAILLEHENTLRARWIKKSKEQRRKILLTAWPDMADSHRPDFKATGLESVEQRRAGTKFRKELLFPYINLEDLLKAKNLLLFFHSRGYALPDVFAHHDYMASLVGRRSTGIQPCYVNGYTMYFAGMLHQDGYGLCFEWDDVPFGFTDDNSFDLMWSGLGWQPGDGLVILEIQETILDFLVKSAELILHDLLPLKNPPPKLSFLFSPHEWLASTPPTTIITPIPSDATWSSVAAAAIEAPYRVPVQFDLARLQRLVAAKRAEAEDYVWTLREDPVFFQEALNDMAEHMQEVLLNKYGKPHHDYGTPLFWTRMFRYLVQGAYQKLTFWDAIQMSMDRLVGPRQDYINPGIRITPLTEAYAHELSHLSYLIQQISPQLISDFQGIVGAPPLRHHYIREDVPGVPNAILYKQKGIAPAGSPMAYFLWLVQQFAYPQQLKLSGIYTFLEELERVSRLVRDQGGQQSDPVSSHMAASIAELAVISEVQ